MIKDIPGSVVGAPFRSRLTSSDKLTLALAVMGQITLDELMPNPSTVGGDRSWKIKKLGLPDYWKDPMGFLSGYVAELVLYSGEFEGKRPGGVLFVCGRTCYDMYAALDEEIEKHREPYVLYGVLLTNGRRVSFHKWERHQFGGVTKDSCYRAFNFNYPDEVRDIIGPTIRGMLDEVTDHEHLRFLQAGVHTKLHDVSDMMDPAWKDYPPVFV